ncbi:MAG: zinc-dependent alcohol dehydrogenase family protein, partial [Pseudomonadota bacterium]
RPRRTANHAGGPRMRAVQATGDGLDALEAAEIADPPAPGPKELGLDILAATLNPADLLMLEGRYGTRPPPPFIPGAEGVARVREVGAEVQGFAVGDLVIPFAGQCWAERMTTRAGAVVKLDPGIDLDQAAMLKANPATALAMLQDLVALEPGDWVAQNAANSAVGVNVIKIAKALGLKTYNIVRRKAAARRLTALGADMVVVHDGGGLPPAPPEAPRLALDAVGGGATDVLAELLGDGGTVVNYGLLSGEPCRMDPFHLVFRRATLRGFWLADWYGSVSRDVLTDRYAQLTRWLAEGVVGAPVLARYPLAQAARAVEHASKGGRDGKILLINPSHPDYDDED